MSRNRFTAVWARSVRGLLWLPLFLLASSGLCDDVVEQPVGEVRVAQNDAADAQPAAKRFRYWTTNWSFTDFNIQTLMRRLAIIGLELPIDLSGTASVDFDVSVPLNGLRDPQAYRFRGTLSSPRLTVDDVPLEELYIELDYADGRVTLSELRGRLRRGSFAGSAMAELIPRERFTASLSLQKLDLAPIAEIVSRLGIGDLDRLPRGEIDTELQASGRVETASDPLTWDASGSASIAGFAVGDSSRFSIAVEELEWVDRRLRAPELSIRSADHPDFWMTVAADVRLGRQLMFDFQIEADDLPSDSLAELWTETPQRYVSGKLDLQGTANGVLDWNIEELPAAGAATAIAGDAAAEPVGWDLDLAIASPRLEVFGLALGLVQHRIGLTPERLVLKPLVPLDDVSGVRLLGLEAEYAIGETEIELSSLAAEVFGGTIGGSALIGLDTAGRYDVALEWQDLRPSVRSPVSFSDTSPVITGTSSGKLDWSVPVAELDRPSAHRGTASLALSDVRVGGEAIGELDLQFAVDEAGVRLEASGELFGGRLRVRSTAVGDAMRRWQDVWRALVSGEVELRSLSLREAVRGLPIVGVSPAGGLDELSGQLDGSLLIEVDEESVLSTRSGWTLRELMVGNTMITRQLDVRLGSRGPDIEIRSLRGVYAEGNVDITGRWSLADGPKSLDMRLSRVDSGRFLAPIFGGGEIGGMGSGRGDRISPGSPIGGRLSGRATLTAVDADRTGWFGPTGLRVDGSLRLADGTAWGIPTGTAHGPIKFTLDPGFSGWRLVMPRIQSNPAGGLLDGSLTLASTGGGKRGFNLDSRWRVNHVDFESLLSPYVSGNTIGRGDLTGELRLGGRAIRGVNDLSGDFRTRLGGTDATAVPVLASTGSLLGAAGLAGNRFQSGDLVGSFSGGAARIRELSLRGDRMRVVAEGRVGLADGQLAMQAVISTGNFEAQNAILALVVERSLPPLAVLATVNRIASDRTLVLNISGTPGSPQIRVLAAPTATANARRILARELIGLTLPEAAWLTDNR